MTEVLITGYHGYGNYGDEATLLAIKEGIEKMNADVKITALSYDPEFTKTEYGINAVQRFNVFKVFWAVFKSKVIVSGGGTLLQDISSTRSLFYYLGIIKLAKLLGKKVLVYANGIGPVNKESNRKLIGKIVNKVDIITLREEPSLNDLVSMGVTKPPTYVTADPAFNLTSESDARAEEILLQEGIPTDKPLVGVAVRDWKKAKYGDEYIREIAIACDSLIRNGNNVLFIPMQYKTDSEFSRKVMDNMEEESYILKQPYKPKEIMAVIGKLKLTIGMRLHSLIFSSVKNVPMLGIIYDPKVEYYIDVLGMDTAADIRNERLLGADIVRLADNIFKNYDDYKKLLNDRTAPLLAKAKKNDKFLKELIKKA
ncbi:MAG: polysaccharide pyruvyl transferase CsaB [Clostridiales bacterium]|nr:polysaccharide pyruvyl transferase CsaB [Clostridiales bacterium]